jgi:hypothetical protein
MKDVLIAPDVPTILAASIVLLVLSFIALLVLALRIKKFPVSIRDIVITLGLGIVMTVASLVISNETFAGTRMSRKFGWPHFFYETASDHGAFNLGPWYSYLLSNVVFFVCAIWLTLVVKKIFMSKRPIS